MKTKQQFRKNCQAAAATRLLGWQKYHSYGLYRRTEHFVQWLVFEASDYTALLVPAYGIQALAIQFPATAISLGGRVRNSRGADCWFGLEEWAAKQPEIVDYIVNQISPAALELLTTEIVVSFLEPFRERDEFGMVNYGIAAIVAGQYATGRSYLEKAMRVYERSTLEWSRATTQRLQSWLAYAPDELLAQLHQDAVAGAANLRLQEP